MEASTRKEWHLWAEGMHYTHIGYVDRKYEFKIGAAFRCIPCKRWHALTDKSKVLVQLCCVDENGNQCCSDVGYFCRKCDFYLSPKSPKKHYNQKNTILFLRGNEQIKDQRDIIRECGLSLRTIRRRQACFS